MSTILVMDDEDEARTILRKMLERAGYQVMDAADGHEGMRLLREQGADLIIIDIIMPEKEGLETITELRRDFPEVKIIAISGGGRSHPDEYLHLAKKFGAHLTFPKPFEEEELLEAVRKLLG